MYYNDTLMWQGSYLPDTLEFSVQTRGGGPTTYLDDVSIKPATWPIG